MISIRLQNYLHHVLSLPPHLIMAKVLNKGRKRLRLISQQRSDQRNSTYIRPLNYPSGELYCYFQPLPINSLILHAQKIKTLTDLNVSHHFDLLGSGWVQVKHGMSCHGLEGYRYEMGSPVHVDSKGRWLEGRINQSNLAESQRIWSLVDQDYIPIDWHLDFKSGYRWAEDICYLDVPHGHKLGVDIKVPWELARMQHLPHLVWAYALAGNGEPGFQPSQVYVREFRNQVLDFIATNPPRFGVNWKSPMDVGIRVVNWLVAYDIFRAYGAEFDGSFKKEFFCSTYEHGLHIGRHLEWNEKNRGNHYLSNIASLLLMAAYLPCSPETDAWVAFAVQELISEVEYQFSPDGGNFEASTSYHRLSAEMTIYATALILGLPEEKQVALRNYDYRLLKILPKLKPAPIPFYKIAGSDRMTPLPPWFIERFTKMGTFTIHITKPNGHIPQIGDNDNGRFLKLQPIFESKGDCSSLNDNQLDHRHLVAAMNGLFDREDFTAFTGQGWVETEIVRSLAGNTHLPSYFSVTKNNKNGDRHKLYAYSGFGLYMYCSENLYLAVRCGSIGQNGNGGHAHNDNLSFELNVKGKDFIVDGGSYLYTPFPEVRNQFRSTRAHNTLTIDGIEQNNWIDGLYGLFSMRDDANARVLEFSTEIFKGEHHGFGPKHYREFILKESSLIIYDMIETTLPNEINFNLSPEVEVMCLSENNFEEFSLKFANGGDHLTMTLEGFSRVETIDGYYSLGYGRRVKNTLVRCYRSRPKTSVEIAIG